MSAPIRLLDLRLRLEYRSGHGITAYIDTPDGARTKRFDTLSAAMAGVAETFSALFIVAQRLADDLGLADTHAPSPSEDDG